MICVFRRKSRQAVNERRKDVRKTGGGRATAAEVGEDAFALLGAEGLREIGSDFDSVTCKCGLSYTQEL